MAYHFRNLVFEGGGVKGIVYGGALEILAQKGILEKIERVAGTSAGAITAGLVAVGYSWQEIQAILSDTSFKSFMDGSFFGFIGDVDRVVQDYGIYRGKAFQKWFESLIAKKTGSKKTTFAQLSEKSRTDKSFRELYVYGTQVNKAMTQAFNAEKTPHMLISRAVRISMSIPIFFEAVKMDGATYVDGGVYYNYPIDAFDYKKYVSSQNWTPIAYHKDPDAVYNKETLGLRVDSQDVEEHQRRRSQNAQLKVTNLAQYATVLVNGLLDNLNKIHLHKNDWHRTIYCDSLGVSVTDFNLDHQTIQQLVQSGRDCAIKYFQWFDDPKAEEKPLNK